MTRQTLHANTLEEWREQVKEFNRIIRTWDVPLSVGASGTPEVLEPHDKRIPGTGHLLAHGYGNYSKKMINTNQCCTHSLSLISTCFIPAEDKWICWQIRETLLDEGFLVSPQPDTAITHLFHVGRVEEKGRGWINFAGRMDDERAIEEYLRRFEGVELMRIKEGVYLGMDIHP